MNTRKTVLSDPRVDILTAMNVAVEEDVSGSRFSGWGFRGVLVPAACRRCNPPRAHGLHSERGMRARSWPKATDGESFERPRETADEKESCTALRVMRNKALPRGQGLLQSRGRACQGGGPFRRVFQGLSPRREEINGKDKGRRNRQSMLCHPEQ